MEVQWQLLSDVGVSFHCETRRAKVPGGWLVQIVQSDGCGITFYPDPEHKWDGGSLT
jgi:hypothetical protein